MSETHDCLFCKIVAGKIPSKNVYEDDEVLAFHDVNPQAPVHVLVIPKRHIPSLHESQPQDRPLLGHLLLTCQRVAEEAGIGDAYRVVNNRGADAGQSVFHVHFHVLGGRSMGWPPG